MSLTYCQAKWTQTCLSGAVVSPLLLGPIYSLNLLVTRCRLMMVSTSLALLQPAAIQANENALLSKVPRLLPSQVIRPPHHLQPSCNHQVLHHNPSSWPHGQILLIRSLHKPEEVNQSLLPPLARSLHLWCYKHHIITHDLNECPVWVYIGRLWCSNHIVK